MSRAQAGFTLLEVLVALMVLGSVAAMVHVAVQRHHHNAQRLEQQLLAGWLADNTLVELQLAAQPPRSDAQPQAVTYAGRQWWLQRVSGNADGRLYPVEVRVGLPPAQNPLMRRHGVVVVR